MSETLAISVHTAASDEPSSTRTARQYMRWLPLWSCLLITLLVRVWLIIYTHGIFAGDEAVVGIQAEHILRGELPVYYYAQAYLGSLQAYIIAGIFLITGPAVWAMRIEPILTSLFLVYLTWRLASYLAEAAHLAPQLKLLFMSIATGIAAFAPLYDVVEEMNVTGGYIEAFALMLWLLLCAFRLTQRWSAQATRRELALRWAGLGFLVGLGLWIDPLVVYAYSAIALWLAGYALVTHWRLRSQQRSPATFWSEALLSLCALPLIPVGFTPGLIWGAQHQWENITYILHNGAAVSGNRLHMILNVGKIYLTCLAPRALGGALPTRPDVTYADPHILTVGLPVVAGCLLLSIAGIALSLLGQRPFVTLRQLTLLPLLFILCTSIIFSVASISTGAIYAGCGPIDYVGRYVVPLVIALPFLVAAIFILPSLWLQERSTPELAEKPGTPPPAEKRSPLLVAQITLLIILGLYFGFQGLAYAEADPQYTFHSTGCVAENPTDVTPLINYMQRARIHYMWTSGWVGDRITFLTDSAIIATDFPGRIPANSQIVLHQDRPSIFLLAKHTDTQPAFLQLLDAQHVTYRVTRFYSEPGYDGLLVTPLNRSVTPLDPAFVSQMNQLLTGCV